MCTDSNALSCGGKVVSVALLRLRWDRSFGTYLVIPGVYSVLMGLCRGHQARELAYAYGLLLQASGNSEHSRVGLVMGGLSTDDSRDVVGRSLITDWDAVSQEQDITFS